MWRIIQRGFWLKHGTSVKSSTQIVSSCEECRKKAVDHRAWVHCTRSPRLICGGDHNDGHEEHGASGSEDGTTGGPDREWKEHMRYFRHDMWSSGHPRYYLEAVGWGTAVVLGVQMSTICHRRHCRGSEGYGHWCHCGLHGKFRFNKWFTSHVRYTAALVSRILMPDVRRTVKRILPPSSVPSASVAEADETSVSDLCSSGQEANDQHDTESEEFQKELLDFIRNLHTLSAFEVPSKPEEDVDSVASEWKQMVTDYVRGIRANVLALKHAKRGDYRTACRIWLRASKRRYCDATILFNLAICYQNGLGITKDLVKAMECYAKAAQLNHARSAHNLAILHLRTDGADHQQEGLRLLEQAASLGLKEAHRELGVLLTEPEQRDMQRAVTMFQKAAEQQDVSAMYFLGICHERGLGTTCNEAKAAELYRIAASHGHVDAVHNLAVFFENGVGGVPQNKAEAVRLYQRAADGGVAAAAERLKALHPHKLRLKYTDKGVEFSVFGSSGCKQVPQTTHVVSDSQPTLSRFYRSLSSNSAASSDTDTEAGDLLEMTTNESNSSRQHSQTFFLENSSSDDEALPVEMTNSIRRADSDASKPNPSTSTEFGRLLRMMFRREAANCVSQDQPAHHGSVGSFVVPKGSFGSDVMRHVSSFG